ncbi:MAG: DUF1464 family protein [Thermoprotei archaeon]
MVRALGIDPGTGSFDLVVVEKDRVVWEESIDTPLIAKNPGVLVEAVEKAGQVDIIAGPSGYGTPVVCNNDIIDPYRFAVEVLLLSKPRDIDEGVRRGELGIMVYKALAEVVRELWKRKLPVCYIPSVILLPTIPRYRKINKIDMGTADKLAVTVLAVYDQSRRLGIHYSETSFILVEMGFGYNAVIGVENGRVVDGIGGTLTPMGFLTAGVLDGEVVALGRTWSRSDVFYGGVATLCGVEDPVKALEKSRSDNLCRDGFNAMYEGIVKTVKAVLASVSKPREIILSGRLTRIPEIYEEIAKKLENIAPTTKLRGLDGAKISKEAGQGYAVIGEGLAGGFFRELVEYMGIKSARGTVLDNVYHPRLARARSDIISSYRECLTREAFNRILGNH